MTQPHVSWSNISATPPQFTLPGGQYALQGIASAWGTATLQIVGPDGATLLNITGAALSANGYAIFNMPSGTFQLTLATVTGFYGTLAAIPLAQAN